MKVLVLRWLSVVACASLVGCGSSALPRELFTIEASGAEYPVMLSRTHARAGGRKLEAWSGTHKSETQTGFVMNNTAVTVIRRDRARSELSASTKLHAQVRRSDRWIQLDRAIFIAVDYAAYGTSRSDRELQLEGTAHR
jgi:hypothetical protein